MSCFSSKTKKCNLYNSDAPTHSLTAKAGDSYGKVRGLDIFYKQHFRMSKATFELLCNENEPFVGADYINAMSSFSPSATKKYATGKDEHFCFCNSEGMLLNFFNFLSILHVIKILGRNPSLRLMVRRQRGEQKPRWEDMERSDCWLGSNSRGEVMPHHRPSSCSLSCR